MKNILIVDDEPALCQLMKTFLEKRGQYHVDTVTMGTEGIKKVSEFDYNAVILDVLMPDLSGYETLKRIRALPGGRGQVPVIAISARASLKEVFHMVRIHSFLVKPFQMDHLKGILDSICDVSDDPAPAAVDITEPVRTESGTKKVLIAGMEKFMISKIQTYLQQMGYEVVTSFEDSETLSLAAESKPALLLYQFWEDAEKFNATHLLTETLANPNTQGIPCFIFCAKNVEIEASKELPKERLLAYQDSRDLLNKLREHLPA